LDRILVEAAVEAGVELREGFNVDELLVADGQVSGVRGHAKGAEAVTERFAQLQPPPPDLQQLIGAMQGNQEAMDDFVSVQASTLPAPEFFDPENVGRVMAQSGAAP
jgi:phytoene dehydrogenase-like protein